MLCTKNCERLCSKISSDSSNSSGNSLKFWGKTLDRVVRRVTETWDRRDPASPNRSLSEADIRRLLTEQTQEMEMALGSHEWPGAQPMGQAKRMWCVRSTWHGSLCDSLYGMAQPHSWLLEQAHLVVFACWTGTDTAMASTQSKAITRRSMESQELH